MSTMGVAFLAAPQHDDLRNLQFHWVKQSLMTVKFRRYLARARTALVERGASGPFDKEIREILHACALGFCAGPKICGFH